MPKSLIKSKLTIKTGECFECLISTMAVSLHDTYMPFNLQTLFSTVKYLITFQRGPPINLWSYLKKPNNLLNSICKCNNFISLIV